MNESSNKQNRSGEQAANDAYANERFWWAYARMLSCVREHDVPSELRAACQRIAKQIKHDKSTGDQPIRVLSLGFGVGTFEFPFLHCLRQELRKEGVASDVAVTAVDSSRAAVGCAATLSGYFLGKTESNQFYTEDAPAFAALVQDSWPKEFVDQRERIQNGLHDFYCLDLDLSSEHSGFRQYFPSRWFEVLSQEHRDPYNLIVSMFCLHHLKWWRPTLVAAASLLAPNGMILVSEISGDTDAFAGNPRSSDHDLLGKMRSEIFLPHELRSDLRLLQARKTLPGVADFMAQLGYTELGPDCCVKFSTRVGCDVISALIETKGFSPLRSHCSYIEMSQGKPTYAERCENFKRNNGHMKECSTNHVLTLRTFKSSPINSYKSDMLKRHFIAAKPTDMASLLSRMSYSYQIREAGLISSSHDPVDNSEVGFVRDTLPGILHSGILRSDCISLTVGPGLVRKKKLSESVCCPNVLWHHDSSNEHSDLSNGEIRFRLIEQQLEDLLVFVQLRQSDPNLYNFSNAHLTLKLILPLFSPDPAIFTYIFDEKNSEKMPSSASYLRIEVIRRRAFWEVRHTINLRHPYISKLRTLTRQRESLGPRLWDALAEYKESRRNDSVGRFRLMTSSPSVWVDEWEEVSKEFGDKISKFSEEVSKVTKDLGRGTDDGDPFKAWADQADSHLRKNLNSALGKTLPKELFFDAASIKAMAWLLVMRTCKSIAIYPVHYMRESETRADDATIAMYTRIIDGPMAEEEAAKFNTLYDSARMRSSERSGADVAILDLEAKLGHEVIKAYSPALQLLKVMSGQEHLGVRDRFIGEMAQTAMLYGIIQTPTAEAAGLLPGEAGDFIRLGWHLYLLRDVFGGNFDHTILTRLEAKIAKLWSHIPDVVGMEKALGKLRIWQESGEPRIARERIAQLIIILLTNSIKHHYGGILRAGKQTPGQKIDLLIAGLSDCKNRGRIEVFARCHPKAIEFSNWMHEETPLTIQWDRGTWQALDATCKAIYGEAGCNYSRDRAIKKWSTDGRFHLQCELTAR